MLKDILLGRAARRPLEETPSTQHNTSIRIPKNVFFFWEGGSLPERYQRNIAYFKAVNPDYDVKVVDSSAAIDVIKSISKDLYRIFNDITIPAAKSDIARMALLYKYGGWYCDCDSSPRVSPNLWASQGHGLVLFSIVENKKLNIQNSIMGGVQGHPFFKSAIEKMARVICGKQAHYSVYRSSGPAICMQVASDFFSAEDVLITPMDYELVDVISGATKGSWVFQERCGIWSNSKEPLLFQGGVDIGRFESLEAFEFFKAQFDRFPETRHENYRRLLRRAGMHYIHKHGIGEEIVDLSLEFISHENTQYFSEIVEVLRRKEDANSIAKIERKVLFAQ